MVIADGTEDVAIKISDKGGGISRAGPVPIDAVDLGIHPV